MRIPDVKVVLIVFLLGIVVLGMTSTAGGVDLRQSLPLAHEGLGYTEPVLSTWFSDGVSWLSVANAGRHFGRASGGVIGEYLYVFGAVGEPRAQAYNWSTDHWQNSTTPLLGDCNWAGVVTGEAVYLIGRYCDYSFGNEVQKFVPLSGGPTGYWTTVTAYPLQAAGIAAAWDGGNYIYAAGGSNFTEIFSGAYRYDTGSDVWIDIAPLPIPMTYHGGAFVQGKFHVMGGVQEPSTAHFAYDPATDTWTEKADMPIPNHFAAFSLTGNDEFIFSIGGGGGYHLWPATDAVQIYDPVEDTWIQETPLPEANGLNFAAYTPDDAVTSSGGYDGVFFVQQTYKGTGFPGVGTGIEIRVDKSPMQPEGFAFHAPYPNPFNPFTTLKFTIPISTEIQFTVFDLAGSQVAILANEAYQAGTHEICFDASQLSSGIYFARLCTNQFSEVRKLLLIE
jgi:N-acetylneuraminic acid mutarotase